MTFARPLWLLALCVASTRAWAQAWRKEKPGVTFNEIERGVYFGVNAGPFFILNPPADLGTPSPMSPGQLAQVEMGFDFGERLSVGVMLMGTANRAGSDYVGLSKGLASGDFSALIPGAVAKVSLFGFNDSMDVKRWWIYARLGGGYAMFSPAALINSSSILVFGGVGVEYFTRLRHFSVALEGNGHYFLSFGSLGFSIAPSVRYAF